MINGVLSILSKQYIVNIADILAFANFLPITICHPHPKYCMDIEIYIIGHYFFRVQLISSRVFFFEHAYYRTI